MLNITYLDSETKKLTPNISIKQISEIKQNKENIIWADVTNPNEEDFLKLAEEFSFHQLSIEDALKGHQRPKIEEYPGYYFLVVYESDLFGEHNNLQLRELSIFLGANFIVTVHSHSINAITLVSRLWPEWLSRSSVGTGTLAYLLLDAIVDHYMVILDQLSDNIDDLEDKMFTDFQPNLIEEIFRVKKQLLYMRRFISPLRDLLNVMLRREQPLFSSETYVYFQDVFDHAIRVADTIDSLRDILSSIMDVYLSISGNRMNIIMKRLTSISTILMSVTLIAGIYGMNFDFMPELKWRYGYTYALSSMVIIGLCLYLYLRKIKWL
ncbi:MAG: magnesium/cobalt transporter CorA [Acidobacteria bacterium]|nr:magnesium/cobalt transporter CorA [Acidobacteriota bacterium]